MIFNQREGQSPALVPSDHPILHRPADLVDLTQSDIPAYIRELSEELHATILEQNALGLAAVQAGVPLAVFAIRTQNKRLTCVNPSLLWESPDRRLSVEGCLSFPGEEIPVWRSVRIKVRYWDADLKPRSHYLNQTDARVWLHEYDHTLGVTMHDREAPGAA